MSKSQPAISDMVKATRDQTANLPLLPAVFANRMAPVVRVALDGCASC
jgi:hypothetical protein